MIPRRPHVPQRPRNLQNGIVRNGFIPGRQETVRPPSAMDNLIRIVNTLHDATTQLRATLPELRMELSLQLPQIAVVGSQSAGKSSVLENFVGRDFLPRGSGIVTRRPLVLQLIHTEREEYGEFIHRPNHRYSKFDQIRDEIARETDRITGMNKGISPVPINLKIYSPHVLDLTLVDLPGLTKVPVGDQPPDIEIRIREMILQFIDTPSCIVLAVSAANSDLANSDALQLAREVDPAGVRTIGVLTKLDLMDHGTDARAMLDNKVYPLRYGYIGIVNRSQRDIDTGKRLQEAHASERAFFLQHPAYRDIADRVGTTNLQSSLHHHLLRHITESLPTLKTKLKQQLLTLEMELKRYKFRYDFDDPSWRTKALVVNTMSFAARFQTDVIGATQYMGEVDTTNASRGAQIHNAFHVKYPLELADIEFTDEAMLKQEIGVAIKNVVGVRVGIFTPDKAFEYIIKKQIAKMGAPMNNLLECVGELLMRSIDAALESDELMDFPALAAELSRLSRNFIMKCLSDTRDSTQTLLDFQLAYINARHEDFVGLEFNSGGSVQDKRPRARRNPERSVTHRGWLAVGDGLRKTRHWFVLSCDALTWYRDEKELERLYSIPIDETLKVLDRHKHNRFAIITTRPKANVYKSSAQLDLQADSPETVDQWKVKLLNVGIYPTSEEGANNAAQLAAQQIDPHLKWQIETIYILVDSYLGIVRSTLRDMVPKAIVHSLIMRVVDYMQHSLVAELSGQRAGELMEEDKNAIHKRDKLQQSIETCRQALEALDKVRVGGPPVREYSVPAVHSMRRQNNDSMGRQNNDSMRRPNNNNDSTRRPSSSIQPIDSTHPPLVPRKPSKPSTPVLNPLKPPTPMTIPARPAPQLPTIGSLAVAAAPHLPMKAMGSLAVSAAQQLPVKDVGSFAVKQAVKNLDTTSKFFTQ